MSILGSTSNSNELIHSRARNAQKPEHDHNDRSLQKTLQSARVTSLVSKHSTDLHELVVRMACAAS